MAAWEEDLANKAKDKYAAQRQEDERFNREQRLKETLGKDFWNNLRHSLEDSIKRFNQAFGGDVLGLTTTGTDTINITAQFTSKKVERATLTFQPEKHTISWASDLHKSHKATDFYLDLIGDVQVIARCGTETFHPASIAENVLRPLTE